MAGLGDLVGAASWFAVLAPVVGLAMVAASRLRYRERPPRTRRALVVQDALVALSVLGTGLVTLYPVDPYHTGLAWGPQLVPFASIVDVLTRSVDASVAVRIVGLNVALFAPLGFALALRLRRATRAVAAACGIAAAIEVLQAVLPLGRTANVDDIVLNTLGAVAGAGIAVGARRAWRHAHPGARDASGVAPAP